MNKIEKCMTFNDKNKHLMKLNANLRHAVRCNKLDSIKKFIALNKKHKNDGYQKEFRHKHTFLLYDPKLLKEQICKLFKFAAMKGRLEIVQYLIENCDIAIEDCSMTLPINQETRDGALTLSVNSGHFDVVKYLIELQIHDVEKILHKGITLSGDKISFYVNDYALKCAVYRNDVHGNNLEIMQCLLEHEADVYKLDLDKINKESSTYKYIDNYIKDLEFWEKCVISMKCGKYSHFDSNLINHAIMRFVKN